MLLYLLTHNIITKSRFFASNALFNRQKIAIIGDHPKTIFFKKKLMDENFDGEVYQFSNTHEIPVIEESQANVSVLKQIMQKLNPHSLFLRNSTKLGLFYNAVDREIDQKLGLKRIYFEVENINYVDGKINILTRAQNLPSSNISLSSKTFKNFTTIITSDELENSFNAPLPKAHKLK
jgi:hypothetical protein